MPELPEVETIRYDIDKYLSGYVVSDLSIYHDKMIVSDKDKFINTVVGAKIIGVSRKAKLMIFDLGQLNYMLVHLKMTGRLLIREKGVALDRWTKVIFHLEKGEKSKELRFADQRMFGYLKLVDEKELKNLLSGYGPEPLTDLSRDHFKKMLMSKRIAIKKILLDQSLISGIGNIYANDALYLARIHPERLGSSLSDQEIKNLFDAIEVVLKNGLKYRGASDNSYLDAFGEKGEYQEHFLVYGRQGNSCLNCKSKIIRYKYAGRGTFICPQCQVNSLSEEKSECLF